MDEERVVHVRGTPCSGKTVLAHLLWEHYEKRREPVVFLDGWCNVGDTRAHLIDRCEAKGYFGIRPFNLIQANVVFILDEAQQSYYDQTLWISLIKTQSGMIGGSKFCLFSSYGSPAAGPPQYARGTPIIFGPQQRISITASRFAQDEDLYLFYNPEEFEDVVNRICLSPDRKFTLDPAAREYLYSMTNGHPGATDALVKFIFDVCISCSIY